MADEERTTLKGKIVKILYLNHGWGIATFQALDRPASVKIKGSVSSMEQREPYEISGHFETSDKYGKTFAFDQVKELARTSIESVQAFFQGDDFPGIGPVAAKKLYEFYDGDPINKIIDNYDSLDGASFLKESQKETIKKGLQKKAKNDPIVLDFFNNNLKLDFYTQLKEHTEDGTELEHILQNDFYQYAHDKGLEPFSDVDKVARFFGKLDNTDPERIAWYAYHAVNTILFRTGDTYTNLPTLLKQLSKDTNIDNHEVLINGIMRAKNYYVEDNSVNELGHKGILVLKEDKETGEKRIYTWESWDDEQEIANDISKLLSRKASNVEPLSKVDDFIEIIEEELASELNIPNFRYDEFQKEALRKFARSNFFLLTGGPGTGKTITIKGMYKLYKMLNNINRSDAIGVAAPTGRAAARINEIDSEMKAVTIHRMLGADEDNGFLYNQEKPLEFDMIILDESSMIENGIFANFLKAAGLAQKIVLVGDKNQLPSVGYGDLFGDLLKVEQIPKMNLNSIHRQKSGNGIIDLSYMILNDEIETIEDIQNLNHVQCYFDSQEPGLETITNIFRDKIKSKNDDISEIQMITPYYKGDYGINAINDHIEEIYQKEILKKTPREITDQTLIRKRPQTNYTFSLTQDDKIMFSINDVEAGLSNGDVGVIKELKTTDNSSTLLSCVVDFEGNIKDYSADNLDRSYLAYACSVHKTQGSEYDTVVFSLEKGMYDYLLNKRLIYTAVTRARTNLVLVGDFDTFLKGIKKKAKTRKTTLVQKIDSLLPATK